MESGLGPVDRLSVSVVIPTLNAGPDLGALLSRLREQRPVPPDEILVVDSGSRDGTVEVARSADNPVRVIGIADFTHGRARNLGVRETTGDIVVFMSQDAIPENVDWLAELVAPYAMPEIAATFSRQVPRTDANPMERFFLNSHFPFGEPVHMRRNGHEDLLFQRDVFFSNVSSSARRPALVAHPFDEDLIMSEDQQFARDVILAGHSVVYSPSSVVVHSHNYSFGAAVGRYFDSVYSLRQIFPKHSLALSVRMGCGYLWREAREIAAHNPEVLPRYVGYVLAKTLGTVLGHVAERLPTRIARRISMHKEWWKAHRRPSH
jgi:rhamnosyltransferase